MAYSITKLITNAYYLSKVRSQDYQMVGGDDIEIGVDLFNEIQSESSINTKMIPFYKEIEFPCIVGQEKYYIPNLVQPISTTFNLQTVRYATNPMSRMKYHATTRVDGIRSMPFNCSFERVKGGCDLYVYFLPIANYPLKIWGKFAMEEITIDQLQEDLSLVYEMWYIRYLRYYLSREICNFFGISINPEVAAVLRKIEGLLNDANYIDLTANTVNLYNDKAVLNWPMINLGRGIMPGNS